MRASPTKEPRRPPPRKQVVRVAVAEEEGGAATVPEKAGGTHGRRRGRRHARPSLGGVRGLVGGSNTWAESAFYSQRQREGPRMIERRLAATDAAFRASLGSIKLE